MPKFKPTTSQLIENVSSHSENPLDSIVEFRSSVFYAEESIGSITVEVVRLGPADDVASVKFRTNDGSGVAGRRYKYTEGVIVFETGEKIKSITIELISNESYDATLEFEISIFDPQKCLLGGYLHTCRIIVVDDDTYPTNKYAEDLRALRLHHINPWSLMLEFYRMNVKTKEVWRSCVLNIISDQILNLRYIWHVLLMNYLIDSIVLQNSSKESDPWLYEDRFFNLFSRDLERVCAVVGLSLVPHFVAAFLTRAEINRHIRGRTMHLLQGNLLRKFLNYDESSRHIVPASELVMATARDIPELIHLGLMPGFHIAKELGLLVILMITIFIKRGAMPAWLVLVFFVSYVVLMCGFLWLRQPGIERRQDACSQCQCELVDYVQQVVATFRLIADYCQKPTAVAGFEERSTKSNHAMTSALLYDTTTREFAPFLTTIFVGLYIICQFQHVIDGQPVGDFVSGIAMWTAIGKCFENMYRSLVCILESMEHNRRIVKFMNLPVDVSTRMFLHRKLLVEAREEWRLAQDMLREHQQRKGKADCYALDLVNFKGRDLRFQYPMCTGGTLVFNKAEFDIPLGKLVAVTGPRGGGKATLLGLIGGVNLPDEDWNTPLSLFIPPHLRVLHVSQEPLSIEDISMFDNLCYGPSDGQDEDPERVIAICTRLGVSDKTLELIRAEVAEDPPSGSTGRSTLKKKSTVQWANRRVLSYTDQTLLHLARAFVMNPEVLVIHKPLNHFDDLHARLVVELLREFVDQRGIEKPKAEYGSRRPRTCIFSTDSGKYTQQQIDLEFYCAKGAVKLISLEELGELRVAGRKLFQAMEVDDKNSVNFKAFAKAITSAFWVAELVGIDKDVMEGPPDKLDAALHKIFATVDYSSDGEVDVDELIEYLRGQFDHDLPRVLDSLSRHNRTSRKEKEAGESVPGEQTPRPVAVEEPTPRPAESIFGLQEMQKSEIALAFNQPLMYNGGPVTPTEKW